LENRTADAVVKNLLTLGITCLAEWDVLAFVHSHGTTLVSAEKITGLLGYTKVVVGEALESLTTRGFVHRSRNSHGVRVYRFPGADVDEAARRALRDLLKATEDRQGRLLLIRHLRAAEPDKHMRGRGGLHLA
jgi:DNA-binding MarR family transcriptional regulator